LSLTLTDGTAALSVPEEVTVGGRFRIARRASERTVAEMATALGVSKATYERIESGARSARRGEVIAMAQLTGQEIVFFGASPEEDGAEVLTPDVDPVNAP
jgi:transcriptional regulator with XRE-family HTH domain